MEGATAVDKDHVRRARSVTRKADAMKKGPSAFMMVLASAGRGGVIGQRQGAVSIKVCRWMVRGISGLPIRRPSRFQCDVMLTRHQGIVSAAFCSLIGDA